MYPLQELTKKIIAAAIEVHKNLGPGLLEIVYFNCLCVEFELQGLAYQKEVPVNWCPALKTVLANEEVIDGKSERGGHPVIRMPMKQWMIKITDYAEKLLQGLEQAGARPEILLVLVLTTGLQIILQTLLMA